MLECFLLKSQQTEYETRLRLNTWQELSIDSLLSAAKKEELLKKISLKKNKLNKPMPINICKFSIWPA